jgi:hypothetical protein
MRKFLLFVLFTGILVGCSQPYDYSDNGEVGDAPDVLSLRFIDSHSVKIIFDYDHFYAFNNRDTKGYNIYRSCFVDTNYQLIGYTETNYYIDTSMESGKDYFYRVGVVNISNIKGNMSLALKTTSYYEDYIEETNINIGPINCLNCDYLYQNNIYVLDYRTVFIYSNNLTRLTNWRHNLAIDSYHSIRFDYPKIFIMGLNTELKSFLYDGSYITNYGTNGQFVSSKDMILDRYGNYYIIYSIEGINRVYKLDRTTGSIITNWDIRGDYSVNKFVARYNDLFNDYLYILRCTDSYHWWNYASDIDVYDTSGNYIKSYSDTTNIDMFNIELGFRKENDEFDEFHYIPPKMIVAASAISMDISNNIYIIDNWGNRIQKLSQDNKLLSIIGNSKVMTNTNREIYSFMTVDKDQNIYVLCGSVLKKFRKK